MRRETITGIAVFFLGNGISAGLQITGLVKPTLGWIIIGLSSMIGIGLLIYGRRLTTQEEVPQAKLGLSDIVTLLQKMDRRISELSQKELKKHFNATDYVEANKKLNEIIGWAVPEATTVEAVKTETAKLELKARKQIRDRKLKGKIGIADLMPKLMSISGLLDSKGYGLKGRRTKDKAYRTLYNELLECRNLIKDDELNKMIRLHVEYSETLANLNLALQRNKRVWALANGNVVHSTDFMSSQFQGQLELFEHAIQELLIEQRKNISIRIEELEGKKPVVEVKPDCYSLVVKNKGTFAIFDVSIKVIKDYMNYNTNRVYKGIWQNTTHYETRIMKDGFDTVLLATHADVPSTNPPTIGLAFPYYDMNANKLMYWQSGLWFWTPKEQKSKPLYPEYEFEITINSSPEMPRNFVKNYKVDLEGLHVL